MELLEFKHENDPARNRELFGLLGEYAASSSIREKLGGVISATHLTTTDFWTRKELYLRYGFAPVRKIGRFVRFKKEFERGD